MKDHFILSLCLQRFEVDLVLWIPSFAESDSISVNFSSRMFEVFLKRLTHSCTIQLLNHVPDIIMKTMQSMLLKRCTQDPMRTLMQKHCNFGECPMMKGNV